MVFSVSPSVIVREVDATAVIPAIATPPAAIAGVFRWGPTNERTFITSEQELAQTFGKPYANTTWQNYETFFTAADYLSYSNSLYVTRVTSGANTAATGTIDDLGTHFGAKYPGELGNSIEVSYVTQSAYESEMFSVQELAGPIDFNSNTLTIVGTEINSSVTPIENDVIRIGNDSIGYQDLTVQSFSKTSEVDANTSLTVYTYDFVFKNRYTLSSLNLNELSITKLWGFASLITTAPNSGSMHVVVRDKTGNITGTENNILEVYQNISSDPTAKLSDGTTNYYRDVIENRSSWITTKKPSGDDFPAINFSSNQTVYQQMQFGLDGRGESDSLIFSSLAQGYDLYRDANEVDISFVLQGKAIGSNVANYIVANIADRRKDCVAFISPPFSEVVTPANPQTKMTNLINFRTQVQSSSYWFMDTGYKYRYDKYNDVYRWVPLNGDIAGLCSRIESWESPAGYKRGIIKNVVKLAFNPNKEQRDILYGRDINPVISQVGQGVLLFGDKTGLGTASGSAFTRINVRRLFITVEKAIATVAASFLFDFNDEFTQTQFKNLVEPFLRDIQGRRGIIDFRVASDATVNTPDIIDRNIFRGNIFIKPARSINVIELTFVATRTGIEFDEIVGQPL
jgi:hypothetical protein